MKSKTSAILITGVMLSAAVLPVQADPMLDLLKVLRDKGTISAEDSNGPQKLDSSISALPGYAANLATG